MCRLTQHCKDNTNNRLNMKNVVFVLVSEKNTSNFHSPTKYSPTELLVIFRQFFY